MGLASSLSVSGSKPRRSPPPSPPHDWRSPQRPPLAEFLPYWAGGLLKEALMTVKSALLSLPPNLAQHPLPQPPLQGTGKLDFQACPKPALSSEPLLDPQLPPHSWHSASHNAFGTQ